MGSADDLLTCLAQSEVFHLAFLNEIPDCAGNVFNRYVLAHPVLIEQIDSVGVQALEGLIGDKADPFGPAVPSRRVVTVLPSKFRGDDQLVAHRREGLAHYLFVCLAVGLGRVKQRHAALNGCPDHLDGLIRTRGRAQAVRQPHAAKPDRRHFKTAISQIALLHPISCPNSDGQWSCPCSPNGTPVPSGLCCPPWWRPSSCLCVLRLSTAMKPELTGCETGPG